MGGRDAAEALTHRKNGSYYSHCDCPINVCVCVTAGCLSPRNPHVGGQDTARSGDHLE